MKGVILCGGKGSRLGSLTLSNNKHLLPVYDKPMVYYPIETLVGAGIKDILIVFSNHMEGFIKTLKNGEDFGLDSLNYAYQEGDGGIADALSKAKSFVGGDKCAVVLGDNLIFDDISSSVSEFEVLGGAMIFTKSVYDPERFGVVEYDPVGGGVSNIIEKPENPPSSDAVIGLYFYDSTVFNRIEELSPSERDELEVTDLNIKYLEDDALHVRKIHGTWVDCGTPESLYKASKLMFDESSTDTKV